MGALKKMAIYSAVIASVVGLFTKVLNVKHAKRNIIKKVVLVVLFKLLRNTVELSIIKLKCFFQTFWKQRVKNAWKFTTHKFTGETI